VVTSNRILTSYFTIAGMYTLAAALIWGVNTLFLLDAGLDIFEEFIANAAFTAGSFFFEIPTGVLADTRGRRASLLLSVIILFVSTLAYVGVAEVGGGVLLFSFVSVLMGLGFTFYSGAVDAWLVDALEYTGYDGQLDHVFARGSMVTGTAMLVGTIGGGLLGSLHLALPYVVRAVMLVAVFAVALTNMPELGFTPRVLRLGDLPREMKKVARQSIRHGWQTRPLRLLMVCSFFQWAFLTWGFYAWQPYLLGLLAKEAVWISGIFAALISLSMIAGNALVDWFSRWCGRRTTLLLWAAGIQTAAAVGVGVAGSFWLAAGLFLVVAGTMGVGGPVKQAYIHQVTPSEHRASVISFDSMLGSAGSTLGQSGLGYLSRTRSIADAYMLGGLVTFAALPVLVLLRRLNDRADIIVGRKGGLRSDCAAQGIPQISQVDARPRAS